MNELLEILRGLKEEICSSINDGECRAMVARNFDRAIEIVEGSTNVDYLRGKVEAYEKTLGGNS